MMWRLLSSCFVILLFSYKIAAQEFQLPNEKNIFSFQCEDHYWASLYRDSSNEYLIYRFGKDDSLIMEYPTRDKSSWNKFKFGYSDKKDLIFGHTNDLYYVSFWFHNKKYIMYKVFSTMKNQYQFGIKILDLDISKLRNYFGLPGTDNGNLNNFKYQNLLKRDHTLYGH